MTIPTFSFEPANEQGVVFLFGRYHGLLGFEDIIGVGIRCPDCTAVRAGRPVRIEFEHLSSDFIAHGHDPAKVDVLVCWIRDVAVRVETLELRSLLRAHFVPPTHGFTAPVGRPHGTPAVRMMRWTGEARNPRNREWIALLAMTEPGADGLTCGECSLIMNILSKSADSSLRSLVRHGLAERSSTAWGHGSASVYRATEKGISLAATIRNDPDPRKGRIFRRTLGLHPWDRKDVGVAP